VTNDPIDQPTHERFEARSDVTVGPELRFEENYAAPAPRLKTSLRSAQEWKGTLVGLQQLRPNQAHSDPAQGLALLGSRVKVEIGGHYALKSKLWPAASTALPDRHMPQRVRRAREICGETKAPGGTFSPAHPRCARGLPRGWPVKSFYKGFARDASVLKPYHFVARVW
jgi:hypothetical protein